MHQDLMNVYQVALEGSQLASKRCLEFRRSSEVLRKKKDSSWVTDADISIEQELKQLILKNFPNHSILGEETGGHVSSKGFTWILDPIDGTFSFVHNVPFYSCLIGVYYEGSPVVGVAALPAMNITMSAYKGGGAYINGHKYSKPDYLGSDSIEIIATSDIYRFYQQKKTSLINEIYEHPRKARVYGDALGYYLLLNGSVRIFVDPKVEIWDTAPFHVIMPEAGFSIHDWAGAQRGYPSTSVCYSHSSEGTPMNCSDVLMLLKKHSTGM